jgi:hypothetical protein
MVMQLPSIQESDLYKYLTLVALLVALLFGYRKGRDAAIVSGKSLGWTQIPLIVFAIATIGPSVFAIIIYLGYRFGLIQPEPSGCWFSIFIRELPFDFAVINWGFVALYLACRMWPNFGSARFAMWLSRGRDVSPKCFVVSHSLGDGFQRRRCGPGHWLHGSHGHFACRHDHLARASAWYF